MESRYHAGRAIMKTTSFGVVGGTLLVLALAACERTQATEEPTGRVMLSITSAPADAACLRITVKGATMAVRLVPLMTGMSTVFPLEGLPLGPVDFTGEAFPLGCGMVGANSLPSYVSEAVRVTLMDGETANVAIVLRRPGQAVVSVDFPGAPDAGQVGLPPGAACTSASACTSGFCASGVCCDTACTGVCQACNISPGRCVPRPAGIVCAGQSCMGATFVSPSVCNGAGMCVSPPPQSCAPYVCGMNACRTSCTSNADCQMGFNCQMGSCVGGSGQPNGSTCGAASQCASGFCASGVCCETACTAACQACNISPGRCLARPAGSVCAGQSCMGSTFVAPSFCSGAGMCVSPPPQSCAPYVCGMNSCQTSCASNTDCQVGFSCQAGACVGMGMPVTVGAEADAYVRDGGAAAANFGADFALQVKNSTAAGNTRIAYLRFPLGSVASVGQARLRLYGTRATASMLTDAAFAVASNTWTETGITWNTRPTIGGKLGASVVVTPGAQYYEWNVTAHVQAQKMAGASAVSLAVQMETATNNSPDSFHAREAGEPPQLVIMP
jgi:hypothetical protein